eukprot:COSAG03_NODE_5116_length_1337_cov_5.317447_3_plen_93_part_00
MSWQRYWEGSVDAPDGGPARLLLQLHSLRLRAAPFVGRDVRSHKRKGRSEETAPVPGNELVGLFDPFGAPMKRSHKKGQGIKARLEAVRPVL